MGARHLALAVARVRYPSVVLDTCVLIDAYLCPQRGLAPPIALPVDVPLEVFAYSLYEFLHGRKGALLAKEERDARRAWLDEHRIGRVTPGKDAARTFESLLHTASCPPGVVDALIAAGCVAEKRPLLTRNLGDFEGVPGLVLVQS
jgi:predicted nucleic acid-binding protein